MKKKKQKKTNDIKLIFEYWTAKIGKLQSSVTA